MFRVSLVHRRQVWLPTAVGWLLLLALAAAGAVFAGVLAYPFLAPNAPLPGARVLVVEGWLSSGEFAQAAEAFRRGRYERVFTTGGPIDRFPELLGASNYADFAAGYLRRNGLTGIEIVPVPAPAAAQDRSFLSAVALREWTLRHRVGVESLDVFTSGAHARRSRMLYRMAFGPSVGIGVIAARPAEYEPERWWRTSVGAKAVLGESIGLAWTACCFHPSAPASKPD